jgi:hypothetical protein
MPKSIFREVIYIFLFSLFLAITINIAIWLIFDFGDIRYNLKNRSISHVIDLSIHDTKPIFIFLLITGFVRLLSKRIVKG